MPELDLPRPGLGTWQNTDPEACARSVEQALEMGYRHLDTAQAYRNEEAVGRGLARASVDRDDVVVATKVWYTDLAPGDVRPAVEASLDRLGLDRVDLLYVHWPAGAYDARGTLPAFEELRDDGLVDHLGVSNFTPDLLREAVQVLEAPVVAHQLEMHPLLPQRELRDLARDLDLWSVAYSPLARGRVLEVPELVEVAEAHDATAAQVSLAWLLHQDGVVPIPKSSSEAHLRENWEARELELSDEEVARIDGIERRARVVDPGFAPW